MQKPLLVICLLLCSACGSGDRGSNSSFETEAEARLLSTSLGPGVSQLTGKLLSVGLQPSFGKGMQTYLLTENFQDVDGSYPGFDFDMSDPVTTSGSLSFYGGSGAPYSNANFLFAYLDATFEIPYPNKMQVTSEMLLPHTVRFVLADGISGGSKRGDLLLKDSDGTFKWMSSAGVLSATRPISALTMDSAVVNHPSIPVFSTEILASEGVDSSGKTYSFDFDASSLIVFMPAPNAWDIIQSKQDMLQRIHLQGLPHSQFTFDLSATSSLSITAAE